MTWPGFPKRLQSALKALCCLAEQGTEMQAPAIAEQIDVPRAETAKVLQLLVWGGFVTSRRGIKGGFQLAAEPGRITMGEVIDFFLSRHPQENDHSPLTRAMQSTLASGQDKFARLTLSEVTKFSSRSGRRRQSAGSAKAFARRPAQFSKSPTRKRRSQSNATNR